MKRSTLTLEELYAKFGADAPSILLECNAKQRDLVAATVAKNGFVLPDVQTVKQLGHEQVAIRLKNGNTLYT